MDTLKEFNGALTPDDWTEEESGVFVRDTPPKSPKVRKGEIWEVETGRYRVVSVSHKGKFLKLRRI